MLREAPASNATAQLLLRVLDVEAQAVTQTTFVICPKTTAVAGFPEPEAVSLAEPEAKRRSWYQRFAGKRGRQPRY